MRVDPFDGRLMLYGGSQRTGGSGPALRDTSMWDGRHWLRVAGNGPDRCYLPVMGTDPLRQALVLYCGAWYHSSGRVTPGTAWLWAGRQWSRMPLPRR